jgi:hypothetical protein
MTDASVGFWDCVRRHRNKLLDESDKYVTLDYNHSSDDEKQKWIKYRNVLRDITSSLSNEMAFEGDLGKIAWPTRPDGIINTTCTIKNGSMKLWVTNENGSLQAGDSLVLSNTAGYFTKGEPAVVTIKDACDFSASTTETYYSNIVSVTESNVVTTSETAQEGYTENAYWTSNSVSYYTGNVVSHYSNVVVYDDVNVYTNVEVGAYANLATEVQGNYTAVLVSQDSVEEVEGYTPVLSYSNISSDRYDANVHTEYTKVVTHYSNISVVETVEYSNISASAYEALDSNLVVTPGYTSFFHELSNTSIRVQQYASLTPEQRSEYTIQSVPAVTSNLQSFYTPQTRVVTHEIKDVGDYKAAHVECTLPI